MTHHLPNDTNAAMIDINMLPLALHKPFFVKHMGASQHPRIFLYPELEAAIIAVTHIK